MTIYKFLESFIFHMHICLMKKKDDNRRKFKNRPGKTSDKIFPSDLSIS